MEEINKIAPHETFEIHELLTIKNISATKCAAMSALVKDKELKDIMRQEFDLAQGHIAELSRLIQSSVLNDDSIITEGGSGKVIHY
jgi:similar to spore coat protein